MEALKTIDNKPVDCIFGVYSIYIGKLTYHFFITIDDETESLEHITLFTTLKQYATLIKSFGPMYIYFYDYPPYSGAIYEIFETNTNAHIR